MAAKKRVTRQRPERGEPGAEQDVKRRIGGFTGKGEHARQGGREGIPGQRPGKFKTDRKK
jgi:hypothetical protein